MRFSMAVGRASAHVFQVGRVPRQGAPPHPSKREYSIFYSMNFNQLFFLQAFFASNLPVLKIFNESICSQMYD